MSRSPRAFRDERRRTHQQAAEQFSLSVDSNHAPWYCAGDSGGMRLGWNATTSCSRDRSPRWSWGERMVRPANLAHFDGSAIPVAVSASRGRGQCESSQDAGAIRSSFSHGPARSSPPSRSRSRWVRSSVPERASAHDGESQNATCGQGDNEVDAQGLLLAPLLHRFDTPRRCVVPVGYGRPDTAHGDEVRAGSDGRAPKPTRSATKSSAREVRDRHV